MKKKILSTFIFLQMAGGALQAQSVLPDKINRNALCTTGSTYESVPEADRDPAKMFPNTYVVETDAKSRMEVLSAVTRAVLSAPSEQKVRLNFTYIEPIYDPINNQNGHLQIGIKLKAANTCNVLYAIWDIGNRILEVSLKRNDGAVGRCKNADGSPAGYTLLLPKPTLPEVVPGSNHSIQAEYVNGTLNVWADQILVWSGVIGNIAPFDGPVGFRTDGGHFKVDFYTDLQAPLTAANLNTPYVIDPSIYPCFPAKPSIQYPNNGYVLEKSKAITPIVPISYGGPITNCTGTPPAGLKIDRLTCAISGTPTNSQASTILNVTASNGRGMFNSSLSLRVMAPPSITYSATYYKLTTTASTSIIPTYAGNAVESCSSDKPLPAGLTLSSQCGISGQATALSPKTTYQITAKNLIGTSSKPIDLEVISPPILIYSATSFSFKLGSAVSITLRNNYGAGSPPTQCSIDKPLPAGLQFNTATCTISGNANAKMSATTFKVTGTNSAGSGSVSLTISVL